MPRKRSYDVLLPKLHKRLYKARFNANSSSCTTTNLSKLLTSCLTAVKSRVMRYYETVYERSRKNMFWSKCLFTYDFSTLYTTLPHNLIKEKLLDLIERAFKKIYKNEGTLYLVCNDRKSFFISIDHRGYTLWSCQNICNALSYLLDNIYIRFGYISYTDKLLVFRWAQIERTPLVADFFLFCYERDFMTLLLFLMIIKPIFLRHLTQPLDI